MTLTGIAKASAIYMLGGQVAAERFGPARHASLVTEAGL
mgnify:CR=1 FL=1